MGFVRSGFGLSFSDLYEKPAGWASDAWDWASDGDSWADVGKVMGCKLPTGMIVGGVTGGFAAGPAGMAAGAGAGAGVQGALAGRFCPRGGVPVMVRPDQLPPRPPLRWHQRRWAPPVVAGGLAALLLGFGLLVGNPRG